MIDHGKEDVFLLREAPSKLKLSARCLWNYIHRGKLSADKLRTVQLEAIQLPAGEGTSMEAYSRFIKAINTPTELNGKKQKTRKKSP